MTTHSHDWRQTAGCLTLVMACVCLNWWARSYFVLETLMKPEHGYEDVLGSGMGIIYLKENGTNNWGGPLEYRSYLKTEIEGFTQGLISKSQMPFLWLPLLDVNACGIVVPYWFVTVPMILLSAYLLLSKPRSTANTEESD